MCKVRTFGAFLGRLLFLAALTSAGQAQTFSVLYNFGSNSGDPVDPQHPNIITQGRDGNLYSTTPGGGTNGFGAMFNITPEGTLTVPYSFDYTHQRPFSGLTLGTDGNFYGTTDTGGTFTVGTMFKITANGTFTVLYNFGFDGGDGYNPVAPPIQGTDGNFYGTTAGGGANIYGTVYKITPCGKLTTLYSFDDFTGGYPLAPLVQGTDGNFYGTTLQGGKNSSDGVVFKITPAGKFTVLHNFDGMHGGQPVSPLVQGSDGNFYGTTVTGGSKGNGVVFKITPTGKFTVLHNINGTTDGNSPFGGLVQATDGNFYGSTAGGGNSTNCPNGCGTIFRIAPKGGYSVLHTFDLTTGSIPEVTLFQHTNGILYGDTSFGGTGNMSPCRDSNCGVFYSLNLHLKPFVSLLPYSSKVGHTIEFLGQGFKGTTAVTFNGISAKFCVKSDTYLTATVPKGATTGFVSVTTPKGKLKSNKKFRVL